MTNSPILPRKVALAVLLVNGRYLLQLRDNKPAIDNPGVWGLFGGSVEPGETAAAAISRELAEELCIHPTGIRFLKMLDYSEQPETGVTRLAIFEADVTPHWGQQRLTEGQAAQHFAYDQLAALPMPSLIRSILANHQAKMALQSVR